MQLSSLPSRPLELAELRELNDSGRFRAVFPAAVFDIEDSDYKLVPVAVLVTDGTVVGVGYDADEGWTRVSTETASETDDELKEQVEAANRELQQWARETEQQWAEPDGASALLAAFEAGA
ncbi:hypothetical protein [Halorarius litoreus]|uniref:hypothetical protein n=1 Tax=Halorarius litoreus TaxID=2962676 RepID=UPI0020CEC0F2|nr:hypothetical protein [Halorarius litoreus]